MGPRWQNQPGEGSSEGLCGMHGELRTWAGLALVSLATLWLLPLDANAQQRTGIGDCAPPRLPDGSTPRRWSCRTGTQGTEGNPNCPPPYIPGVGYPKNWSCPTGRQSVTPAPAPFPSRSVPCTRLARATGPATAEQGGSIMIGGGAVSGSEHDYRCHLVNLTVPPQNRQQRAFVNAADLSIPMSAIHALETDDLRVQIVNSMLRALPRLEFASMQEAKENVGIRIAAVRHMQALERRGAGNTCRYYEPHQQVRIYSNRWESYVPPATARTATGVSLRSIGSPYQAIMAFKSSPSEIECQTAVELTILLAVAEIVGQARFDRAHADGLRAIGVNDSHPEQSIRRHLDFSARALNVTNMVPGDWAYMRNKVGYAGWAGECRRSDPGFTGGYWTGENAIFVGSGPIPGRRVVGAMFSGLGLWNRTEADLRADLVHGHNTDADACSRMLGRPIAPATPADVGWTMLARLRVGA